MTSKWSLLSAPCHRVLASYSVSRRGEYHESSETPLRVSFCSRAWSSTAHTHLALFRLNEQNPDALAVSWFDHARDLLHMINHFRAQMPRPIAGIGHSMGGANLINLSLIHPRLLQTLILIDPVVQRQAKGANAATQASTFRRDIWPSRQEAAKAFGNSKFYRAWDGRVLDRWMQYGLRELPTIIHPDANTTRAPNATPPMPTSVSSRTSAPYARGRPPQESALTEAAANFIPSASPTTRPATSDAKKAVTLTTPKHFELHTFARRNFEGHRRTDASNRHTHPDIPPHAEGQEHQPFYRPEPFITFANLPFLRPSVLYVFGETSEMSTAALRREKMEVTGTSLSGSGGAEQGRVKEVVIEGTGHLVPMEKVGETAGAAAHWLELEMALWRETEERESREWRDSATSLREKQMVGHEWVRKMSEGMKNGKAKL